MTNEEMYACNGIIHTASAAAGAVGAGLAQLPCSDSAVITPIQIGMILSLGKVFGIDLDESAAKSLTLTPAVAMVGRAGAQLLVGWIPGIGNIINAGTAVTITESMGWIVASEFEKRRDRAA